ncbi:histidinol-phosphatase [Sphingomonas sp. HDW15A]|uniref:inositol monophosphatase family protein n=1 Tax=Sphingomonas sp. HDW15A TaxID=2714942 RepID=UPI00140A482F|nr:inositol monophosphatase family protein [Sphingomonas sp. HDW15A]QIK95518.1 histidinol-phosphatase [Sphingomonas sp. HDW15A]
MTDHAELTNIFADLSRLARQSVQAVSARVTFEDKGAGSFDPVTALDRDIEKLMRDYLLAKHPDHGVWGEEFGWSNEGSPIHWSIDPIDGTRAFICGLPSWCVLVGYLREGRHQAGMIDCPSLGELLVAVGGTTLRNGEPVVASNCMSLATARLATTDPCLFDKDEAASFSAVRQRTLVTRYGLDALAYARVATGDLDLVIENKLQRHDLDALVPVVRGAGGHVGDWSGGEDWDVGRIVAAASRALYDEAVAVLSR